MDHLTRLAGGPGAILVGEVDLPEAGAVGAGAIDDWQADHPGARHESHGFLAAQLGAGNLRVVHALAGDSVATGLAHGVLHGHIGLQQPPKVDQAEGQQDENGQEQGKLDERLGSAVPPSSANGAHVPSRVQPHGHHGRNAVGQAVAQPGLTISSLPTSGRVWQTPGVLVRGRQRYRPARHSYSGATAPPPRQLAR